MNNKNIKIEDLKEILNKSKQEIESAEDFEKIKNNKEVRLNPNKNNDEIERVSKTNQLY